MTQATLLISIDRHVSTTVTEYCFPILLKIGPRAPSETTPACGRGMENVTFWLLHPSFLICQ